uniref:Uncharacterized protein n=1 Tax=Knipowitschia caucasica TaxID=637954 RepID=A0AAV2JYE5_KNICA
MHAMSKAHIHIAACTCWDGESALQMRARPRAVSTSVSCGVPMVTARVVVTRGVKLAGLLLELSSRVDIIEIRYLQQLQGNWSCSLGPSEGLDLKKKKTFFTFGLYKDFFLEKICFAGDGAL